MPVLSYMDNIFKLSHCFVNRDYGSIRNEILDMKEELNYRYEEGGEVWGYRISKNIPVSGLYGFDAYVVRFYFTQIDTLHNAHQEQIMESRSVGDIITCGCLPMWWMCSKGLISICPGGFSAAVRWNRWSAEKKWRFPDGKASGYFLQNGNI